MTRDEEDALVELLGGFARQDQALRDALALICLRLHADQPAMAAHLGTMFDSVRSQTQFEMTEEFRDLAGYLVPHLRGDPEAQVRSMRKPEAPTDRERLRAALRVVRGGKTPDEDGPSTGE